MEKLYIRILVLLGIILLAIITRFKSVIFAILIILLGIVYVVYYNPIKEALIVYSHKLPDIHTEAMYQVFVTLEDMEVEWWPIEGTLIGLLRWGGNFGQIDDGIVNTDTDIDIMIRVKDEDQWKIMKKELERRLRKYTMWKNCQSFKVGSIGVKRNPKFTCYTNHNYGPGAGLDSNIHVDFHSYIVDETSNLIYMDDECKRNKQCAKKYPFQKWNGTAPYKGLIVNDDGKFRKVKFQNLDIPCPYKPIEVLSNWNNNEYGSGNDLHLPRGCSLLGKYWKVDNFKLTDNDKKKLYEKAKELDDSGYMSFINYY